MATKSGGGADRNVVKEEDKTQTKQEQQNRQKEEKGLLSKGNEKEFEFGKGILARKTDRKITEVWAIKCGQRKRKKVLGKEIRTIDRQTKGAEMTGRKEQTRNVKVLGGNKGAFGKGKTMVMRGTDNNGNVKEFGKGSLTEEVQQRKRDEIGNKKLGKGSLAGRQRKLGKEVTGRQRIIVWERQAWQRKGNKQHGKQQKLG